MGFSRQEYWSGLPWSPPGDLLDPEIEPASLMSPALKAGSLPLATPGKPKDIDKLAALGFKPIPTKRLDLTKHLGPCGHTTLLVVGC